MPRPRFLAPLLVGASALAAAGFTASDLRSNAREAFAELKPVPQDAIDAPAAVLGRALFWDERLSTNGKTACASCHTIDDYGADRRRYSIDARGKPTGRHSQTVFNAALQPKLRWAADRDSLAHQAEKSITGSMGFAKPADIVPLLQQHGYAEMFRRAFPESAEPVAPGNYAAAIAAYEATLITPAPFDTYLAGDEAALTETQRAGLKLFLSVGCADCHRGTLLGGEGLRKFGVAKDYWLATGSTTRDAGRFDTTREERDHYRFRVPMLRNIARTGPYFHDGSVADLVEAVQVMAEVQLDGRLPAADAAAIAAFLESLSGDVPKHFAPPR